MNVLNKLKRAFPDGIQERAVYTSFKLRRGATIYVAHNNDNIARINSNCFKNFPNYHDLERYILENNIPIRDTKSHPDAEIDGKHIDPIISIIKTGVQLSTPEARDRKYAVVRSVCLGCFRRIGSDAIFKKNGNIIKCMRQNAGSDWPTDWVDWVVQNAGNIIKGVEIGK